MDQGSKCVESEKGNVLIIIIITDRKGELQSSSISFMWNDIFFGNFINFLVNVRVSVLCELKKKMAARLSLSDFA